jgi:hypothetical protein
MRHFLGDTFKSNFGTYARTQYWKKPYYGNNPTTVSVIYGQLFKYESDQTFEHRYENLIKISMKFSILKKKYFSSRN